MQTIKAAHQGSVSALGVVRTARFTSKLPSVIVSGASDGLLKVWLLSHDLSQPPTLAQSIDLKGRFPLDLSLLPLPNSASSQLLMTLATTTNKINIYASTPASKADGGAYTLEFQHKLSLEGHEDWVKSLDLCNTFTPTDENNGIDTLLLASASKMPVSGYGRLLPPSKTHLILPNSRRPPLEQMTISSRWSPRSSRNAAPKRARSRLALIPSRSSKQMALCKTWAVTFDALLVGHDNWVTGVRWHPPLPQSRANLNSLRRFFVLGRQQSHLMDAVGQQTEASSHSVFPAIDAALLSTGGARRARGPTSHHLASSIWMPSQRFGEVGGASNLGFFGALWLPSQPQTAPVDSEQPASAVLAHGWGGSAHIWTLSRQATRASNPQWQSTDPVTGHFAAAKSVAWEPCGEYLLSCSDDQTTRLHARPMLRGGQEIDESTATWHEVARPSHTDTISTRSHGSIDSTLCRRPTRKSCVSLLLLVDSLVPQARAVSTAPHWALRLNRAQRRVLPRDKDLALLSVEPEGNLLEAARKHGNLFKQTVEQYCKQQSDSVTAIVSSSLFQRPFDGLSFKQIELYLKWLYAQAWSVAVQRGLMLADITVLLVPDASLGKVVRRLYAPELQVLVDASLPQASASIWQQLCVDARKIESDDTESAVAETIGQDDGKGLKCYAVVALGGTFDHLHVGHKILLTMASIIADRKIIVGVTDDAMLTKKSNAALLEPIDERIACVNAFISLVRLPFDALEQQWSSSKMLLVLQRPRPTCKHLSSRTRRSPAPNSSTIKERRTVFRRSRTGLSAWSAVKGRRISRAMPRRWLKARSAALPSASGSCLRAHVAFRHSRRLRGIAFPISSV